MSETMGFQQDPAFAPFACEIAVKGQAMHVIPSGELDVATVPRVAEHVQEVREAGFTDIVLDLRHLRFLDSTGLSMILRWATSAGHGSFRVVPGPDAVQRIFEVTGTTHAIDFVAPPPRSAEVIQDGQLVACLDRRIADGAPLSERFITLWGRALADHLRRAPD